MVGIAYSWEGESGSVHEVGIDEKSGKTVVRVDPNYFRPAEVELLHGLPTKAEQQLGWKRKVDYEELIKEMVLADLEGAKADSHA